MKGEVSSQASREEGHRKRMVMMAAHVASLNARQFCNEIVRTPVWRPEYKGLGDDEPCKEAKGPGKEATSLLGRPPSGH